MSALRDDNRVLALSPEINLCRSFNKKITPGIYVILCNQTGQYYVGESEHVDYRIGSHVNSLEKNKNECKPFLRSLGKIRSRTVCNFYSYGRRGV